MDERARGAYRFFGTLFLVVGAVFALLGLGRALFWPDLLNGDPLPVALVLGAIGIALRRTVRAVGEDEGEDGGA